jgi:sulfate/thiosulfate transport system ATP-binding protein
MSIEIKNLNKRFGSFQALQDVNLTVRSGELVALLGPSGCGKTTLLRIISGLEVPDSGQILIDGEDVTFTGPRERRLGFVFQHYALFKHMTIFENIAFGLKVRSGREKGAKAVIETKVRELLNLIQLDWLADRYPSQLSGGQRQRVALARALAVDPTVLLLDEPFGALDYKVRKELRRWLRRFHDDIHITSIFVTHDQEEALEVADKVVVMHKGRIEQIGSPDEVYEHPANSTVYDFLGDANIFRGRILNGRAEVAGLQFQAPAGESPDDTAVSAYIRPHEVEIHREPDSAFSIQAQITSVHALGQWVRVELRRADNETLVEAQVVRRDQRQLNLKKGEHVFVKLARPRIFVDAKG